MKNFLRGGRELPQGQDFAQSKTLRHYDRNVMERINLEGLIEDNLINGLLRLRLMATPRKDGRSANRSDVARVIIIFCVLFSSLLVSPVYGQGAEGFNKVEPLRVGDVVPDDFWTYKHLVYVNGDTMRMTLEEHKGKLLVLDFWMIGCSKCFTQQKEINYFKSLYKDNLAVVLVNGSKTGNRYNDINKALDAPWVRNLGLESFSSIIESDYLDRLFAPVGYPRYYWINRFGILQTCTMRNLLDSNYQAPFLDEN